MYSRDQLTSPSVLTHSIVYVFDVNKKQHALLADMAPLARRYPSRFLANSSISKQ